MNLTKEEEKIVAEIQDKVRTAIDEKTSGFQAQLDHIFTKFETSRPATKGFANSIERKETNAWLKKFFKKELQTKESGLGTLDYMATDPDSAGGVLVPDLLALEIMHCVEESGVARRKMRYMPFSGPGNSRRIPKELGSITVSWVDEAGKKPVSNLILDEVVHELKKLAVISIMTEEIVEDSAIDLLSFVAKRIADAISEEEDRVFFAGDTALGDPFDGILNATGVVTVPMGAGDVATDITADDLLAMVYAIPKSGRRNAEFYFHSDIMYYIQRLRVDLVAPGDNLGGYLVTQPTDGQPPRLWGYPVNIVDQLPDGDTAVAETPFAIFGNLERTCVYGDKGGFRIKLLDQATIEDAFGNQMHLAQQDAVALRVFKRVGYVPVLPGCIAVLTTGE
jgi:HK97 family phage major capsid protein